VNLNQNRNSKTISNHDFKSFDFKSYSTLVELLVSQIRRTVLITFLLLTAGCLYLMYSFRANHANIVISYILSKLEFLGYFAVQYICTSTHVALYEGYSERLLGNVACFNELT